MRAPKVIAAHWERREHGDSEATEAIRDLVETATVFRDPTGTGGVVEIVGRLNALIGEEAYPNWVKAKGHVCSW